MSEPSTVSFGFKKTTKVQNVGITGGGEEGPARIALSVVERSGVFRTTDGRDADNVPVEKKAVLVIPKQENTYKAGTAASKFKPSFIPPSADAPVGGKDGDDKFESAAPATGPSEPQVYGLQHVQRREKTESEEGGRAGLGGSITERLTAAKEEQVYHRDVEVLPEMASVEEYEAMPIEEFGMAMLRGMGWKEGMGVGRNRKVVDAIEYLKRPERLGLGAQAALGASRPQKQQKMGDAPEVRREDLMLAPDADGRQRHVRKLDEKLVKREDLQRGPRPGKEMIVIGGRHEGLRCVVVQILPKEEGRSERSRVKLKPSDEVADVRSSDLGELADLALQQRQKQLGIGKDLTERKCDNSNGQKGNGETRRESVSNDDYKVQVKAEVVWLYPRIKVRVIDKKLQGGRLYLKKGQVVDVQPGAVADVSMDEGGQVLQVHQSLLETVLPKEEGSSVLVVAGKLRGSKGRLLKRNASEGVAAIQLASDFSVHRLLLDDVAAFAGRIEDDDDE